MSKSIKIARLIEIVDTLNKSSTGEHGKALRIGANSLLEITLHECGVYAGFGYMEDAPAGEPPGIVRGEVNRFPDESRIFHYLHHSLR